MLRLLEVKNNSRKIPWPHCNKWTMLIVHKTTHVDVLPVSLLSLTLGAVDRVDGLLPAGVLLRSGGQTAVLVQVELEPDSQSVQLPPLSDGQADPLNLPGAQALQLLQRTRRKRNKRLVAWISAQWYQRCNINANKSISQEVHYLLKAKYVSYTF